MGYKSVSLTDEVYRRLKSSKSENESFSDFIDRLLEKPSVKELLKIAGAWSDVIPEELEALKSTARGNTSE